MLLNEGVSVEVRYRGALLCIRIEAFLDEADKLRGDLLVQKFLQVKHDLLGRVVLRHSSRYQDEQNDAERPNISLSRNDFFTIRGAVHDFWSDVNTINS